MAKAIFLLLLVVLFPVVGLGVVSSSLRMLSHASAARDWPTVTGEVLSSEVVHEVTYSRSGPSSNRSVPIDVYSAKVQYEYEVNGAAYRGEQISIIDSKSTDRYQAELTAEEFSPGAVTVYYNPDQPQEALLAPAEVGAVYPGLVIGGLLATIPPLLIVLGLRYEWIDRPDFPLVVRMWWRQTFGNQPSNENDGLADLAQPSESPPLGSPLVDDTAPADEAFRESIVAWDLKHRVELAAIPEAMWIYAVLAAIAGVVVAWVGMMPVTKLIYGRETLHLPELRGVAASLFAVFAALTFIGLRWWDRGTRTELDFLTQTLRYKREFAPARYFNLNEVERIVVRSFPVEDKSRKYRAAIELAVNDEHLRIAQTTAPRRKEPASLETAATLAEPLADAIGCGLTTEECEK